ncbi:hypothetical protein SLA2020_029820 [Shorea laevis]
MWALRRSSNPLKSGRISLGFAHTDSAKLETSSYYIREKAGLFASSEAIPGTCISLLRFYHSRHASSNIYIGRCALSSKAGAESKGEEVDLEDGFSELETPASAEGNDYASAGDENEDELVSEPEHPGDDEDVEEPVENELELSEIETIPNEKKTSKRGAYSELFEAIVSGPGNSVHKALEKWVEEGKELSREEISLAMLNLRKRKMFGRALQLSEWLQENKKLDFNERDYAARLDLIAKVRGLQKAENFIEMVPKSFRGELIYRTLLANCVFLNNGKKAEMVFNRMKDLEFPITAFACNQLLLLYKRHDRKKIADVLLLMEKENVKPTLFTYKTLIDTKGISNDIAGMEQIVEAMKAEGIEPDLYTQFIVAKHYASGGLANKAEEVLKEMEGDDLTQKRWACKYLLSLYAELGKADEVGRIWKVCESNPRLDECLAAIDGWGRLKKIEEAEAIFEKMLNVWTKPSSNSKYYSELLKVYSRNKMVEKGKDLVKRMADSGCRIGPSTWDSLVKLYVEAGEVEKADSILQKAAQQNMAKPLFVSYMTVMNQYAKKGDVHNSEKMFHRMRQAGYTSRLQPFQALIQAYVNAKAPLYGIRERMKADNIFPNKSLVAQLAQVDPFKKTAVSDLLD